jgi:hypothetical protein
VLRGAAAAGPEDLWPITYLVQSKAQQEEVRELLDAELKHSHNPVLSHSVARGTYGATAHAAYLAARAAALLEERPDPTSGPLHEVWLVRLETMLTRIDAAFQLEALPPHLATLRASIEAMLEAESRPEPVVEAKASGTDEAA